MPMLDMSLEELVSEKKVLLYPDFGHEGLPGFDDVSFQFFMELQ